MAVARRQSRDSLTRFVGGFNHQMHDQLFQLFHPLEMARKE